MARNGGDLEYDLVTIGAGSGGVRASRLAAGTYGAKVRRWNGWRRDWIAACREFREAGLITPHERALGPGCHHTRVLKLEAEHR